MIEQDGDAGCDAPPGWHASQRPAVLARGEVHVWRIPLEAGAGQVDSLTSIVSAEERDRAARFIPAEARRRFLISHAAARQILGGYLGRAPEEIRFAADPGGKPHLALRAGDPSLSFNLSHSHELALCAVADGRAVGVDVEWVHPVSYWRQVAERYFTQREREALHALPEERALETFFRVWTRKEACAKALGVGLSEAWAQMSVPVVPRTVREVVRFSPEVGTDARLALLPLEPGPEYVGAVAATGEGWHVSCWQWCPGGTTAGRHV